MNASHVRGVLIAIWLVGLVVGLVVPVVTMRDIPNLWDDLINQSIDTYAPGLTAMLAFAFATRPRRADSAAGRWIGVLAMVLALIYCGFFASVMIIFWADRINATELVSIYEQIRPKVSFLAVGLLSYYFAFLSVVRARTRQRAAPGDP